MAKQPKVLVVFDEPEQFSADLERRFPDLEFGYARDPDSIISELERLNPEVVFSIKHPGFPGETHRPIIHHPSVTWVQIGGSGYEQFIPWDRERLTLTNAAGVLSRFLAETVTAAMLSLNCNLPLYAKQQQRHHWENLGFLTIADKTLLIVGAGAIGGYVADNAKVLGMTVLGIRGSGKPHRSVDEMHPPAALESLLPRADVVSLHVRATDETRHLVNERTLSLMKRGAMFINTARGAVVDEAALTRALASGQVGSAYLDVFEREPLPGDSPLWDMPNVIITPHASDAVRDWPVRLATFFADNLARWIEGEALENVIEA